MARKINEKIDKTRDWIEKTIGFKGYIKYIYNAELMISVLKPLTKIPYTITINGKERFVLLHPTESLFGKPCYWLLSGYPLSLTCKFFQTNNPILVSDSTQKDSVIDTHIQYLKNFENQNDVLKKDIIKKDTDNLNLDVIPQDVIDNWIIEYENSGKKAINVKTKRFTKGFNEFLKKKLEKNIEYGFNIETNELETIVLEKLVIPMFHTSQDFETYVQSGYNESVLSKKAITINQILLYILSNALVGFIIYTFTSWYYQSIIKGAEV